MKLRILKWLDTIIGMYLNSRFKASITPCPIPSKPQKIAVIKLSAMGDVLCLMPAIRQLQKWHSQAAIHLITTERSNPVILQNLPFISEIKILPTAPVATLKFIHKFKKENYDLCIDADQYYNISTWLALQCHCCVAFNTPAKAKRLNHALDYDSRDNEKKQFLKLIALASNQTPPTDFDVTLPELISSQHREQAQKKLKHYLDDDNANKIIIYPGSSGNADFRRWHIDNYKQIIDTLCQQGHSLYIAGGPDELAIKEQFSELTDKYKNCHNLINELDLLDWFYLMQNHSTLFVGNDAGLLHIAEAAGTAIIGIFGPNIHSKWGSINPKSTGIEIPIESLSCRPCIINSKGQIPQQCQRGDNACLTRITPNQVLTEINNRLKTAIKSTDILQQS